MSKEISKIQGMVWWRREDYPELLRVAKDAANLPATFEDWLVRAEQGLKALEARGVTVVRVECKLDELTAWCAAQGCDLDGQARNRFVIQELTRRWRQSN